MASTGSVLRQQRFVRLWVATTATGLSTWALPFVLGLAVVAGLIDAVTLGAVLAARTVGFIAVMPIAGVLSDRHSPRTLLGWAASATALATVPLAAALGESVVIAVAAALVVGVGQGACRPALQALVPRTVTTEDRQAANAAITVAVRATVLIGPALAAVASGLVGARWLVMVTGALWLLAAWVPSRGADSATARSERAGFAREFSEGIEEARRHPWFLAGLGALAAVIMTGYSVTAVAVPLIGRDTGEGAALVAAAATAYTAGALLGGLVIARWRPANAGWIALGGLAVYAVAPVALVVSPTIPVVAAAYVVTGIGIELFNVPWFTSVQREVAPERLSRVSSLDFLVSYGLAPLGLALMAPAISWLGVEPVLWTCAAVCLLAPAVAASVPSSRSFSATREA